MQTDKIKQFIATIEAERKANKLHINKLCGFVGITPQYYSKLLSGDSCPSADILLALIEHTGLKILLFKGDFIG